MGLLDDMLGQVTGGQGGGIESKVLQALMSLLGSKDSGGVSGLLNQLSGSGLQDVVSSWVGTGPNKAISPVKRTQGGMARCNGTTPAAWAHVTVASSPVMTGQMVIRRVPRRSIGL